jgi:hypothetical protein
MPPRSWPLPSFAGLRLSLADRQSSPESNIRMAMASFGASWAADFPLSPCYRSRFPHRNPLHLRPPVERPTLQFSKSNHPYDVGKFLVVLLSICPAPSFLYARSDLEIAPRQLSPSPDSFHRQVFPGLRPRKNLFGRLIEGCRVLFIEFDTEPLLRMRIPSNCRVSHGTSNSLETTIALLHQRSKPQLPCVSHCPCIGAERFPTFPVQL